MFKNWFDAATLNTILRYALQAIGGILISNGKFDASQWDTISGAILVILPPIWGVIATRTPKVVTPEGATVKLDKMETADKKVVVTKAKETAKANPTLLERIFGAK